MLAHFTQRTTHQSEHLHPLSDTKNKGPCTRPVHTATTVGKPANSGSAMPTFLFDTWQEGLHLQRYSQCTTYSKHVRLIQVMTYSMYDSISIYIYIFTLRSLPAATELQLHTFPKITYRRHCQLHDLSN